MKRILPIVTCFVAMAASWPATPVEQRAKDAPWRKVLDFSLLSKNRGHRAELGDHTILTAGWVSDLGWEVEVFAYPVTEESENLLYDGNNWHGIQPWMVFAWTKHRNVYPDERIVTYQKEKSQIRIVLVDCETRQTADNSCEFVKGRIAVYHRRK